MRRLALAVALLLAAPTAAQAGGAVRAFISLPAQGRLAFVDVFRGRVATTVRVPTGAGPVASDDDGHLVLVGNTRLGVVTLVDGIRGRVLHVFRGLGHPVRIALIPRGAPLAPEIDLVPTRSHWALVADADGSIDVLDLHALEVVDRVRVAQPVAIAVGLGDTRELFVASAGSRRLTVLDLARPYAPHITGRPRIALRAVALAVDAAPPTGVDAVGRDGRVVRVDGVSLLSRPAGRVLGPVRGALAGYGGALWVDDGAILRGLMPGTAQRLGTMRLPSDAHLGIVLGELIVAHGRRIQALDLGYARGARFTAALPGRAGALALAQLP